VPTAVPGVTETVNIVDELALTLVGGNAKFGGVRVAAIAAAYAVKEAAISRFPVATRSPSTSAKSAD
jgi:hypothetical protein